MAWNKQSAKSDSYTKQGDRPEYRAIAGIAIAGKAICGTSVNWAKQTAATNTWS